MSTETENTSPCANLPSPVKAHEWLQKFVGEWTTEAEFGCGEPGQPPAKASGTESTRMIGGFWIVAHGMGEMPDMPPYHSVLTLGYDPEKQKYIGTWIDSMTSYLWKYEGEVDASGRILKLETEGFFPGAPDKLTKFEEVTEFIDDDHRVFTSSTVGDDGSRNTMITIHFYRKK